MRRRNGQTAVISSRAGREGNCHLRRNQCVWSQDIRQEARDLETSPLKARVRCLGNFGPLCRPPHRNHSQHRVPGKPCSGLSRGRRCPGLCLHTVSGRSGGPGGKGPAWKRIGPRRAHVRCSLSAADVALPGWRSRLRSGSVLDGR